MCLGVLLVLGGRAGTVEAGPGASWAPRWLAPADTDTVAVVVPDVGRIPLGDLPDLGVGALGAAPPDTARADSARADSTGGAADSTDRAAVYFRAPLRTGGGAALTARRLPGVRGRLGTYWRREVTLDTAAYRYRVREVVGASDVRAPADVPLSEFLMARRQEALGETFRSLSTQRAQRQTRRNGLGFAVEIPGGGGERVPHPVREERGVADRQRHVEREPRRPLQPERPPGRPVDDRRAHRPRLRPGPHAQHRRHDRRQADGQRQLRHAEPVRVREPGVARLRGLRRRHPPARRGGQRVPPDAGDAHPGRPAAVRAPHRLPVRPARAHGRGLPEGRPVGRADDHGRLRRAGVRARPVRVRGQHALLPRLRLPQLVGRRPPGPRPDHAPARRPRAGRLPRARRHPGVEARAVAPDVAPRGPGDDVGRRPGRPRRAGRRPPGRGGVPGGVRPGHGLPQRPRSAPRPRHRPVHRRRPRPGPRGRPHDLGRDRRGRHPPRPGPGAPRERHLQQRVPAPPRRHRLHGRHPARVALADVEPDRGRGARGRLPVPDDRRPARDRGRLPPTRPERRADRAADDPQAPPRAGPRPRGPALGPHAPQRLPRRRREPGGELVRPRPHVRAPRAGRPARSPTASRSAAGRSSRRSGSTGSTSRGRPAPTTRSTSAGATPSTRGRAASSSPCATRSPTTSRTCSRPGRR